MVKARRVETHTLTLRIMYHAGIEIFGANISQLSTRLRFNRELKVRHKSIFFISADGSDSGPLYLQNKRFFAIIFISERVITPPRTSQLDIQLTVSVRASLPLVRQESRTSHL